MSMKIDQKLVALLRLLDDPDPQIFEAVYHELQNYGKEILPSLEYVYQHSFALESREKLAYIIQDLRFEYIYEAFDEWLNSKNSNLLEASYLLSKWLDYQVERESFIKHFNKIKMDVWIELNNTLTAFEKIHILNTIFYQYYNFELYQKAGLLAYNPYHLMTERMGSKFSFAVLYVAICEALDLPVFAINLPNVLLLAYYESLKNIHLLTKENPMLIQHFIDPENGFIHGKDEVLTYIKSQQLSAPLPALKALDNKEFLLKIFRFIQQDPLFIQNDYFDGVKKQLDELIQLFESVIKDDCD